MRNVLVTGASRGLGLAIAVRLAASGHRAIAVARRKDDAFDQVTTRVRASGVGDLVFEPFDLAEIKDVPALIRRLTTRFGPIWALVNNAGVSAEGLLANLTVSQIEAVVRLNTLSPLIVTKHVVRSMMAAGEGRVINIASITALTGFAGLSVYGASKASMIGFTKSLAREVGELGITVNAVAPGFLDTDMTRGMDSEARGKVARRSALRRLTTVEEVADAVDFLIGLGAASITGTVITVDAGATA